MKRIATLLVLFTIIGTASAQRPIVSENNSEKRQTREAQRKFQIIVANERSPKKIQETNQRLLVLQESSRENSRRGLLDDLLWQGYTSAFKQKTVNATSNLISLGLNYITEAIKGDREKWYRRAQQQCSFNKPLSAETKIDDFYALPSTQGAMDPENLKFEGFGCKNYIEVMNGSDEGIGVFYIFCKMRRDSVGLRHIVNHSKFLVEIDSLVVNPTYCNLPNDSTGSPDSRFSFEKRDNLNLELKVRLYSSWMNQATMIANNQLLGEFVINVFVDKNKLNSNGLFVYDKNDRDFDKLISIDGDCFIVPRSYTGTTNGINYQPSWGTGQYRVEMEVSEHCTIVDRYYQIRESGKGEIVAAMEGTPDGDKRNSEKWKWDKAKWKVEWKAMNSRRRGDSFFDNAWKCIVSAYKGNGWVATFTDPFTTALYSWETQKLGNWIDDIHENLFPENAGGNSMSGVVTGVTPTIPTLQEGSSNSGGQEGQPKVNKPTDGGKPQ